MRNPLSFSTGSGDRVPVKDGQASGSLASLVLLMASLVLVPGITGCSSSPWEKADPAQRHYSMLDIPLGKIHSDPARYRGLIFEDSFKFFRIYHDRETADFSRREQVIAGKTHFTARPLSQFTHVVQIQITPAQEQWIRTHGIGRRDVVRAQIRFSGIAPGGALAFDLLKIME